MRQANVDGENDEAMRSVQIAEPNLPGAGLDTSRMPGHWLLARSGKRVLRPGGRALTRRMLDALAIGPADAVVELAPGFGVTARETDTIPDHFREEILPVLGRTIKVGARPLTPSEWRDLLTRRGFVIQTERGAPMHLLGPRRVLRDEGLRRTLRLVFNIVRDPIARRRIWAMRRAFQQYHQYLGAIALVAIRPAEGAR